MAASYPSSVKTFTTKATNDTIEASHVNDIQAEVTALEDALLNAITHDLKFTDALFDIGKSGATRPRDAFFSRDVTVGRNLTPGTVVADLLFTDALYDIGKTAATRPRDGFFSRNVGVGGTLNVTGQATFTLPLIAPGSMVLLKAASGTDTTAAATNVDTIAISGLTAKDTLIIEVTIATVTQPTGNPQLYNSTDGVKITDLTNGGAGLVAGTYTQQTAKARQSQGSATSVYAYAVGLDPGLNKVGSGTTYANSAFTTAWTGAWTLALRHTGVTAGGTCQWAWAVYKLLGQ